MVTRLVLTVAFSLCLLGTGCIRYVHDSQRLHIDGTVDTDRTSLHSFLYVGSANKIRSDIKATATNYSRSVSVGALAAKPDSEFIEAVAAGAARGAIEGAAKAAGKP